MIASGIKKSVIREQAFAEFIIYRPLCKNLDFKCKTCENIIKKFMILLTLTIEIPC